MDNSPLELVRSVLPAQADEVEKAVAHLRGRPKLPARLFLGDLKTPVYGDDPTELIKHRFMFKGGLGMFIGPTGIGKSSFIMQLMVHFTVGKAMYGIEPGDVYRRGGMRIMMIQAENDEGDLAEMRDGILAEAEDLTPEEKALAGRRLAVVTVNDLTKDAFGEAVDLCLEEYGRLDGAYDLVIVDPAFAYLGGDSNKQEDVTYFMRTLMLPIAVRHAVGMFIVHHGNKPLRGAEKESWKAGDFAYLGAGSAEWINPARCSLALRSVGSESVFELVANKRGKRLRWKDGGGKVITKKHVAHNAKEGVISWHLATADEIAAAGVSGGGAPVKSAGVEWELLHAIAAAPGFSGNCYCTKVAEVVGSGKGRDALGKTTVRNKLEFLMRFKLVENKGSERSPRLHVSETGRLTLSANPSVRDWRRIFDAAKTEGEGEF